MKTFIFGAGASVPFFKPALTTRYLTKMVCNKASWENVMDTYKRNKNEDIDNISPETIVSIIDKIRSVKPEANFEQIGEVIDKISSYMCYCCPMGNMFNLTAYSMGGFSENDIPASKKWYIIPFLFREIIAESILKLQDGSNPNYRKLSKLQHKFFAAICKQDPQVNVMSLNYDDCLLDSLEGLSFETGFSLLDSRTNLQIDTALFMNADKIVYFPHGHLRFQYVNNVGVSFWQDSNRADMERWNNIYTVTVRPGTAAYDFNSFMLTGQTKDEALNYMPYSVFYHRLAADIFRSDTLYIIGYSFADGHINRMLKSFLKLSNKNKVYVINYSNKISDEIKNHDSIVLKAINLLSDGHIDTRKEDLENECCKLNQQVYFYGKGYQEFLEKDQNLILGKTCPFI